MATILVVDDDPELLRTVERILQTANHTVHTAPDGKTALRRFAGYYPDLVISDVYMPEMDGIEFLIRVKEAFPEASILTMSGGGFKSKEDVLAAASLLGAVATLPKPFSVDEMLGAVEQALSAEEVDGTA
jgi:CheY-like chemotaxis protein